MGHGAQVKYNEYKKQKEHLLESLVGMSMWLNNDCWSWLRERAKEASSFTAGGVNAAPRSLGTERHTAQDPRGLPSPPRALQSGRNQCPHAQPNQEHPVSFQVSSKHPAMPCAARTQYG